MREEKSYKELNLNALHKVVSAYLSIGKSTFDLDRESGKGVYIASFINNPTVIRLKIDIFKVVFKFCESF